MTTVPIPQSQMRQMKGVIFFIAGMVLMTAFLRIIGLITEWFWFEEVGYQTVFTVTLLTKIKTGALFGAGFFIIFCGNLLIALRLSETPLFAEPGNTAGFHMPLQADRTRPSQGPDSRRAPSCSPLFAAANGSAQWENLLLFLNPTPFGVTDPLFRKDIGFYVFQLPFLLHVYGWLKFVLLVTAAATGFLYLIRRSFLFIPPRIWKIAPAARIHLALLIALFFFWGVFGAWLDLNDLLFTKRGVVFGPGYTDVTTQIWVLKLMMGLYALAGLSALFFAVRPDWRIPAAAVLLLVAVSVLGQGIYPSFIQKFQVIPNEIVAEKPYLERNIQYTRLAYGLTQMEEQEFPTEENLTAKDLEKNDLTVKNIRLWNHATALADLQPAPGDADLLQVHRRRQRPLHDQRRIPPGDALPAGDLLSRPPLPDLGQRTSDLHPRLRGRPGPGEPRLRRGAPGVLHQGHPPRLDDAAQGHPPGDLLRGELQRVCLRPHQACRSSTTRSATRTSTPATREKAASPSPS